MKIGILTFHNSLNFGANLQTLATQSMLSMLGYEPIIINYIDEPKMKAFGKIISADQAYEHELFASNYYHLSPPLRSAHDVELYCKEHLDGVVVGSDAVFRLGAKYEPKRVLKKVLGRDQQWSAFSAEDHLPPFWLPWKKEGWRTKKFALAASSRGTSFYYLKWNLFSHLYSSLCDFDLVTVRDQWTSFMVSNLSLYKVNPIISPDPVFGLNQSFELPLNERVTEDLSDVILMSGNFEPRWLETMVVEVQKAGYRVGMLPNTEECFQSDIVDFNIPLPISPLRWYSYLAQSAGFIGMRFHAFVSCLTNKTPVISVDISKSLFRAKNPRIPNYDLARCAGITARYILKSRLEKTKPVDVLTILFDKKTQILADRYADNAPEQLYNIIRRFSV